jgi:acyl-CoA thioesterase
VNVKATLSPDDLARACADAMWQDDDASKGLGMKIVEVRPGQATLTMTVGPHMVNGQRIAHGGFIFTLADSAFAFACNSHNERVVAAEGNITFIRRASSAISWWRPRARFRAAGAPASTMCGSAWATP